ncbi:MAG: 50S ribosomal protein L9 [Bdellovibrionales bacterium RBG_16_40_8]|nr:MAG: 50S ribosomal protein L9 [Bdellovibrionales bacterium RBG_16_40_8]
MKVILQKDVKNVGKVGDVVNVSKGYARNYLFPRQLAALAAEENVHAWEHLKKAAELKKKKVVSERKKLLEKIAGTTLVFKMVSGDKEKIFGSVTANDVSRELEVKGFSVDKRDIRMEPIRLLGQHKIEVNLGENLTTEVTVVIEKE